MRQFLTLLLAYVFVIQGVFAQVQNTDTLQIGKKGSTAAKVLNFRLSNGSLIGVSVDNSTGKVTILSDNLGLGSGNNQFRVNGGSLEFSNDGTVWKKIGSAGGGTGALNLLENGGFEDGVTLGWEASVGTVTADTTSTALVGTTSANFDPAALNDYFRTTYQTVKPGIRANGCEARFLYTGGDNANYSARVETESGNILGVYRNASGANVLPAHSIASYESIFFPCPTEADVLALATNGNIRLVIFQGTGTNATAMKLDDVHLGGLIGLVETTTPDVCSARISSGGVITTQTGGCLASVTKGATGQYTLNFTGLTVAPAINCNPDTNSAVQYICNVDSPTSSSVALEITTDANVDVDTSFSVSVHRQGADAKQSVQVYRSIPRVTQNENIFSARISSSGVVSGENIDWINGNCTGGGTGSLTCTYNSSVVTSAMACSPIGEVSRSYTVLRATSPTQFGIDTYNSAGTLTAVDMSIICQKSGTDYKLPTVQPVIVGQVSNSASENTSLTNIRTEVCRINNSGTATVDTASGLCATWISSTTRSSTGQVDINFLANIFSAPPICMATPSASSFNRSTDISGATNASATTIRTTQADTGAAVDANFTLQCTGKR